MTASNPCCECESPDKLAALGNGNICRDCGLPFPIKETPAAIDMKPIEETGYAGLNHQSGYREHHPTGTRLDWQADKWCECNGERTISHTNCTPHCERCGKDFAPDEHRPEKEWWEEEFEQNWGWIRPLTLKLSMKDTMRRIAAQSEKKGREDERGAVDAIFKKYEEAYHFDRDFLRETKKVKDAILAARSSEEGKTN